MFRLQLWGGHDQETFLKGPGKRAAEAARMYKQQFESPLCVCGEQRQIIKFKISKCVFAVALSRIEEEAQRLPANSTTRKLIEKLRNLSDDFQLNAINHRCVHCLSKTVEKISEIVVILVLVQTDKFNGY